MQTPSVVICKETIRQVFLFQKSILNYWIWVVLAHFFLILTLFTFIIAKSLRRLQGRYVIWLLLFMILFSFLLVPGSDLLFHKIDTPCLIVGILKSFLFTCVIVWYTVFCMELLVSVKSQTNLFTWRRFVLELLLTLVFAALMAGTFVAVIHFNAGPQGLFTKEPFSEDDCKYHSTMDKILLGMASLLIVSDVVILLFASCKIIKYKRLGFGLYRYEARLWLTQGWRLWFIMTILILSSFLKYINDT